VTCVSYTARDWGVGEVWFEGRRLVWHELPRAKEQTSDGRASSLGTRARARVTPTHSEGGADRPPPSRSTLPRQARRGANGSAPIAEEFVHRLETYFAGDRVRFDDVTIEVEGWTQFQLDVMQALRRVPYGEVVSYSDLARLAGYPRAQRAAGTFCAHNRFGIVVPCHRVVGANGIGSYGSLGVAYKQRLLALEGVTL
jgi:methylated-DNA-[protein]-cysteine S-methyltransferase